jgi:hypothetical protein
MQEMEAKSIKRGVSFETLANETIMHVCNLARLSSLDDHGDACTLGFSLRLVSRRMNAMVNGITPTFWWFISISWEHGKEDSAYLRLRSSLAASRSNELLQIRLHAPISDYSVAEDAEHHGCRFFALLLPYIARIKSLDVDFRCVDKLDAFCHLFKHVRMPKLQFLRLSLEKNPYLTQDEHLLDDQSFGQDVFRGNDHVPVLNELILEGFGLERLGVGPYRGSPASLRTVKVTSSDEKYLNVWQWEYFRIDLADMPLLENLSLCLGQNPFGDFWHPELNLNNAEEPITCPNLAFLHLNASTQTLLQLIQAPRLQSLILTDGDLQAITWYFSVCDDVLFPQLKTLHLIHSTELNGSKLNNEESAQLIRHTPAVSCLIVDATAQPTAHEELINYIAINSDPHSWPTLSHVKTTYISRASVFAFVMKRNRPNLTRIEAQSTFNSHKIHLHPEFLKREAKIASIQLNMPCETCRECLGQGLIQSLETALH